jgi:hypothetical protein
MKIIKTLSISLCLTLLWCLSAKADQCAYITKEQASKALSSLNLSQTIYFLCEPCGEIRPTSSLIESLSIETVGYQEYWQVTINGKGIDLAYTFVDAGIDNKLINLAAIANCTATDVSIVLPNPHFKD